MKLQMFSTFLLEFRPALVQIEVLIHLQRYEDVQHHLGQLLSEQLESNRFDQVHHGASHHMPEHHGQQFVIHESRFLLAHHLDTDRIHASCPLHVVRGWSFQFVKLARVLHLRVFRWHPNHPVKDGDSGLCRGVQVQWICSHQLGKCVDQGFVVPPHQQCGQLCDDP